MGTEAAEPKTSNTGKEATTNPRGPSVKARAGSVLGAVALSVVVAVIVVGVVQLSSDRPDSTAVVRAPTSTAPAASTPSPSSPLGAAAPASAKTSDVAFVDVSTGRATPVPRNIRSKFFEHLQASPDGRKLAFVADDKLYVAHIDGSHLRSVARLRVVPSTQGQAAGSWSPDSKRLVLTDDRRVVVVVDLSTGQNTVILKSGRPIYHANFSPDGEQILFTRTPKGANALALWTVPATRGARATVLINHAAFGAYSPDGDEIAFRRTSFGAGAVTEMTLNDVFIVNSDGTQVRSLTQTGSWNSQIDPGELWPMWSPDGTQIAYQQSYGGSGAGSPIIVVDLANTRTTEVGTGRNPTWVDNHTLIVEKYERRPQ